MINAGDVQLQFPSATNRENRSASLLFSGNIKTVELKIVFNSVKMFSNKWNLNINVQKTKVTVFKNGNKVEKWLLQNSPKSS